MIATVVVVEALRFKERYPSPVPIKELLPSSSLGGHISSSGSSKSPSSSDLPPPTTTTTTTTITGAKPFPNPRPPFLLRGFTGSLKLKGGSICFLLPHQKDVVVEEGRSVFQGEVKEEEVVGAGDIEKGEE